MISKRIALVDLDETVADTTSPLLKIDSSLSERKEFEFKDDDKWKTIMKQKGFFLNLPLIDGAKEGIEKLKKTFHVVFCSSPLKDAPFCMNEKYEWVKKHFGLQMARELILIKDKTLIHGDILIDDKPNQSGFQFPSWRQILYSRSYNMDQKTNCRLTWKEYIEEPIFFFPNFIRLYPSKIFVFRYQKGSFEGVDFFSIKEEQFKKLKPLKEGTTEIKIELLNKKTDDSNPLEEIIYPLLDKTEPTTTAILSLSMSGRTMTINKVEAISVEEYNLQEKYVSNYCFRD